MSSKNKITRVRFELIIAFTLVICVLTAFAVSNDVFSFAAGYEHLSSQIAFASEKMTKPETAPATTLTADDEKSREGDSPLAIVNGKLIFTRQASGGDYFSRGIWAKSLNVNPGLEQLSNTGDEEAKFSFDGTKIVFSSDRADFVGQLYSMSDDGFNQIRLTDGASYSSSPAFSPDGTKIVFVRDSDLWVMSADGTNIVRLTNTPASEYAASFSPDGAKILYERYESNQSGVDIWTMNTDGTSQTLLFNGIVGASHYDLYYPSYSPDGTKILINCWDDYGNICTANANGTGFTIVLNDNTYYDYPVWSPDGTKIAFHIREGIAARQVQEPSPAAENSKNADRENKPRRGHRDYRNETDGGSTNGAVIYTINPDGSSRTLIHAFPNEYLYGLSWQPVCTGSLTDDSNSGIEKNPPCVPPTAPPISVRVNQPHPVAGGRISTGEIKLASAVPAGQTVVVNLASSDTNAMTVPASVTIPAGSTQAFFTITTTVGNAFRHADVTATLPNNGGAARATTTVAPSAPDLVPSNLTAPAQVNVFENFSVSYTTTNSGEATIPAGFSWNDAVFISSDNIFGNGNDGYVNGSLYRNTVPLSMNESRSITLNNLSTVVAAEGDYFLFIYVDSGRDINEGVGAEQNNFISRQIRVTRNLPDLVAQNIVAPAEVEPGVPFNFSWDVKNVGAFTTSNGFTNRVYFSFDGNVGGADDILLQESYAPALAINQIHGDSGTFTIPTLPVRLSDDSLLYVSVDVNNVIYEDIDDQTGETNNTMTKTIRFEYRVPDLQVQSVTAPSETENDVSFALNWTTINAGNRRAGSFTDKIYFSLDNQIGNDLEIGNLAYANNVEPNQIISRTQNVTVPASAITQTGDYFVYVQTDAGGEIDEGASEANNITFQTLRVNYRLADLRIESIAVPTEAETETQFALGWTSRNAGNRNAGAFNERVFFSLDNQVGDDVELGSFQLTNGIAANQSVNRIQNVTIPTSAITATGNYFVYIKTDSENAVDEGANETNNITFKPLRVRRLLRPDLTVMNITAPATVFFGQEIQIQWTIKNNGQGATNSTQWADEILLGLNQTTNGAERLALIGNISFLNQGESYIASATVRIPRGRNGSYFILVRTDSNGEVHEENETNNMLTRAIAINVPPLPDLRVSGVQAPEEGFAGAPILVSWTVTNHGTGATPPTENVSSDGIYLSTDTTFDGGDRFIGSRQRSGAIALNGNYAVNNFSVNLPTDVFGDFYVFVVADYQNQIYEFTSENNNSDYDRVQPGSPMIVRATPPDFTILNQINSPATANGGQPIAVSFTVKNQGAFDATGTWREGVYLSADQTFNAQQDTFLGSIVRTNLAAGAQYVAGLNLTLPNCLNGNYYLFAVTDVNNNIFEFDPKGMGETNNVSQPKLIQMTTTPPDLRVTNIQTPLSVNAGQAVSINWTVQNFGTGASGATVWYDNVVITGAGQSPITLATIQRNGSALAAGASYTQGATVIVPRQLEGSYQIVVTTDNYNNVTECDFETNNQQTSAPFSVENDLPDLRISQFSPPSAATLGATFNVSWTGINAGSAMSQATGWTDRVYLSSDQTIGFGDSVVGAATFNAALGAGATYSANGVAITIPNVPAGNYFLLVGADNGDNVEEGNMENNNVSVAAPISLALPQVDLQASNVSSNAVLFAGQNANVSWTITNAGTQPTLASAWTDYIILSRDSVYDPTDRIVGYQTRSGFLNGGASYTPTVSIFIPTGLTGDYTLFVLADRHNQVTESSESNNTSAAFAVNLQLPPPAELNITNITPPASIVLGNTATFTWTVQNSSSNVAGGLWQDSVYLSTDNVWDSSDILVGQQTQAGPVNAFATYTKNFNAVIPPVDPGNYFVIVRTDSRNAVRESNEINNVSTSASAATVSIQNLTLGVPVSTTLTTGQERFFSINNTPANETLLVNLTGEAGSQNELFTRYGSMVSRANYEFFDPLPRRQNQENVVPVTNAGNYYTMIRGDFVPNSFADELKKADVRKAEEQTIAEAVILKAEILPFGIRTVSPAEAGNQGYTFISIDGAKFVDGATVKLVGAGGVEITPMRVLFKDKTNVKALFDLNGKPAGNYQVVLTNPNSQTSTWSESFVIRNGGGHNLRTETTGEQEFLIARNRFYRYTVSVANDGLNDAISVPVLIILSNQIEYQLSTANYHAGLPPDVDPAQLPVHIDRDGKRILVLFVPVVRSKQRVDIGISLKFAASTTITAAVMPPLFAPNAQQILRDYADSPAISTGGDIARCIANLLLRALLVAIGRIIPTDCAGAVVGAWLGAFETLVGIARSGFDAYSTFVSFVASGISVAGECATNLLTNFPLAQIFTAIFDIYELSKLAIECIGQIFEYVFQVNLLTSFDPNEKIGPAGYGAEKFVPINQSLTYRINFENLATATAPAQRIRIVDQLPPTLDSRTVRLKEIGFKQNKIEIPDNRAFYQTRMQLGADLNNLKADISAGLDITNGRITWTLTAIDPATNEQPLNPTLGLLPPNNADHDGEGYVIFTVQAKSNYPTRTNIANNATIFFDDNEPIVTNATANLLDSGIPTSQLTALPASHESPTFNLSWTGSDDATGSGLRDYDVWFSEQDSPFQLFVSTTETSATFRGKHGRTYRFYTTARDNAGNVESPPETFDAMTRVRGGAIEADVAPRPEGNDGQVNDDDLGQIRRFVAKLDAAFQYNEFQRADVAPRADKGNGILSVSDVIQARRYAQNLDAATDADGANAPASFGDGNRTAKSGGTNEDKADKNQLMPPRQLKAAFLSRTGNRVVIGVNLEAQGDEVGAGFTVNFNPAHLSNPSNIALGSSAGGAALTTNTAQAAQGKVGIIVDKATNQPFAAGVRQLITIEFDVVNNTISTTVGFGDAPVINEIVSGTADALQTTFAGNTFSLSGPTSAQIFVSGRVLNASGSGIYQARISLTDAGGAARIAMTNASGYYRFTNVAAGENYIISASHKRYDFANPTRVLSVTSDLDDVDFAALP